MHRTGWFSTMRCACWAVCAAAAFLAGCARGPGAEDTAAVAARGTAEIEQFLAHVEQVFDAGDLDAAVAVFADDAVILAQGAPDAVGKAAIRSLYEQAMAQAKLGVRFHTEEIVTRGDLGYERGTYTLTLTDKGTGQVLATQTNRHVHVFKRQSDGAWKTWRMMTNGAEPAPVSN